MASYTQIQLTVLGVPVAKGRPRFRKVGKYVQTYTPAKTAKAERQIGLEFLYNQLDFVKFLSPEDARRRLGKTSWESLLQRAKSVRNRSASRSDKGYSEN